MQLSDLASLYWHVSNVWHSNSGTITFGVAVKSLRKVIDTTKSNRLKRLAQALMDNIVQNCDTPEPKAIKKSEIRGKRADMLIIDDITPTN